MLLIQGKVLGRKKPLFADWSLPPPPGLDQGGDVPLRELIALVVRAEVEAFRRRQEERHVLRALTARAVEEGVAGGKVEMGGRSAGRTADPDEAVAVAIEAFEDGLYLVVIDGEERKDLDAPVRLTPDSRVAFVRLTLLAGG
jgi:hypothetical protein